jgi:CRP/FNR family cyclic AMP-dependent transcriptional regulator
MNAPDLREIAPLLRQSLLFRGRTDEDLEPLQESVRILRARPGQVILRRGEEGDSMMIVVTGRVKIVLTSDDQTELLLNLVEAGQPFGEMAVLDGRPRSADAIALTDVVLLRLDRKAVLGYLRRHPDLMLRVLAVLCGKIRDTTDVAERSAFLSPPARLYRRLLDMHRLHGTPAEPGLRIQHRLYQLNQGRSIAAARETVNKILQSWKQADLVETGNGWIWIKDVAALGEEVGVATAADNIGCR